VLKQFKNSGQIVAIKLYLFSLNNKWKNMDTLRVEFFEYEHDMPIMEKIKLWQKRKLWFFTVKPEEKTTYNIRDNKGNLVLDNGKSRSFESESSAQDYIVKQENPLLVNATIEPNLYKYFTAQDDTGRFIKTYPGGIPIEFSKEEHAYRLALNYNNDLVKIRQGAANYREKNDADCQVTFKAF
jgi:hypothetical protein